MAVSTRYLAAGSTDHGRIRDHNEDRFHCDPDRGIFMVIDGVGGHAAGETAAETALTFLKVRLERQIGSAADRIREGITLANNEIYRLAQENPEWKGMACVLTIALVEEGQLTIGHVGDSRLYLIHGGSIQKLTHDHSPVGDQEDSGQLTEDEAMHHPRRNEIYNDVGSELHSPHDENFIELIESAFPADAAIVMCSDGLSDLVPAAQIAAAVREHADEPAKAVRKLIGAANESGGKDNITAIVVEGSGFAALSEQVLPNPPHHGTRFLAGRWAFLAYGVALTLALALALKPYWLWTPEGSSLALGQVRFTQTWRVGPSESIGAALKKAQFGDSVIVEPGSYREALELPDGVSLLSERPLEAVLQVQGVAVSAHGLKAGKLAGFRVEGAEAGLRIVNSNIEVSSNEIRGAGASGIEVKGDCAPVLTANRVHDNRGAGITISDQAHPRLVQNIVTANGSADKKPGIEVNGDARPIFLGNVLTGNASEGIWFSTPLETDDLLKQNYFEAKRAIRIVPR